MGTSIGKALASIGICAFLGILIVVPKVGCWSIGAAGIVLAVALGIIWEKDEQEGKENERTD